MIDFLLENPWLLAGAIFLARIADVSLGTLRTILVFRAYWLLAAVLGFLEVVIWLIAAAHVLTNLDEWYLVAAYAGGFAAGNVAGIWLEARLGVGLELVRAISQNPRIQLGRQLRSAGYAVVEIQGSDGSVPVEVLLITEKRRKVPALISLIERTDPAAVCTTTDVRTHRPLPPSQGFTRFMQRTVRK